MAISILLKMQFSLRNPYKHQKCSHFKPLVSCKSYQFGKVIIPFLKVETLRVTKNHVSLFLLFLGKFMEILILIIFKVWLYSYLFQVTISNINSVLFWSITYIYRVIYQSVSWVIRIRNCCLALKIEIRVERYVLYFMVCKSYRRKLSWLAINAFPDCLLILY